MTPRAYLDDLVQRVCAERMLDGPDVLTRRMADVQHGVVARWQLLALGTVTRSEGEQLLGAVLARYGVPRPLSSHRVEGEEVDAVWPGPMVGIELDSWKYHRGKVRFVRDRAKLRRLTLAGWALLPYTAYELRDRPALVAGQTQALLDAWADRVRPAHTV